MGLFTGGNNLNQKAPAKPQTSKPQVRPEKLTHAIVRMRGHGFNDNAIRGQIKAWHPDWSEAKILNSLNAAQPVRTTYGPKSAGGAYAKAMKGGTSAAPGLRTNDLQTLRRANNAPANRMLGEIANPLDAVGQAVGATRAAVAHPGVGTGIGAGIAMAGLLPFGKLGKIGEVLKTAKPLDEEAAAETAASRAAATKNPTSASMAFSRAELERLKNLHAAVTAKHDEVLARGSAAKSVVAGNEKRMARLAKIQDQIAAHQQHIARGESMSAQEALRANLPAAKIARGNQEAGYSTERGVRFGRAAQHLNNKDLPPEERLALAKNELRGELPKIQFQGFNELNNDSVKALMTHILDHPHLMEGQKIRASDALTGALQGRVPTKGELQLLQHVFGKETAMGLGQIADHPLKDMVLSGLNIPRSLMASYDLSAPFRQGLVVATRHPSIFFRNFKPMVKAFGSERFYHEVLAEVHARPTYPMMLEAKLPLTELAGSVGSREEQFASDYAEKIPVLGRGVRASGRAYTAFLDKTRADVFDHLIQRAQGQGIDVQNEKFLKSLGSYIGAATGRGDLGRFQEAAKVLNTFFFSPRLLASRLNFLNPAWYMRQDPFVRKEALRSAVQLAGTLSTFLTLASRVPGVSVVVDPRNPDWGKIKIGHTRIDMAGGFQQPLRLLAQLATHTAISSTTGKKLNLTANGFGQPTDLDILIRFFEGKESPLASIATDKLRNSNQIGQKFSWGQEAYQHMVPLIAQDALSLYNDRKGGMNGLAAAFAGYGIESFGFGLQTYGPKAPKPQPLSGGSGSGSGLFSGGGSGGGGLFTGGSSSSSGGGLFGR